MRLRTVFIVLLIVVLLIGLGPALLAVGSQEVAEAFGCQVDLNRVIPCVIGGKDYGQTFYDLGFSIWYSYLSLPVGLALFGVWAVAALFLFVMGGIYGGLFTATEGAGMGAVGALVFALARRALTWSTLYAALLESARTTAMLFMILIGALIFANFINYTTMPADLKSFAGQFQATPWLVVAAICVIYVVLGTAMEELSMILLTVPLFFPMVTGLGYDPVWFGIIVVIVVQIGLISPPVGMNIFVVKNLIRHLTIGTVFRGVTPFTVALVVLLAIVVAFPELATYLPKFMK